MHPYIVWYAFTTDQVALHLLTLFWINLACLASRTPLTSIFLYLFKCFFRSYKDQPIIRYNYCLLQSMFSLRNPLFWLSFHFWRVVMDPCFIIGGLTLQQFTWIDLEHVHRLLSNGFMILYLVNCEQTWHLDKLF